jgi:hypothetical protein
MAVITIAKINRQRRQGVSKKTGKEYDFESLGIAPVEDVVLDIDGEEIARDGRWLNGSSVEGVTDDWGEGDKVRLRVIEKEVVGRDGAKKKVLNFSLPKYKDPMVEKASKAVESSDQPEPVDPDDF